MSVCITRRGESMPAYLIGHIKVLVQDAWQDYVAGVAKSLAPFSAEIVFRGKRHAVLAGEHDKELAVVIRFANQVQLQEWFDSAAYQDLIPLRDRAADVTIISCDA